MKMKVNVRLRNGNQVAYECLSVCPIGNDVSLVEVLHFDDGTVKLQDIRLEDAQIVCVKLMDSPYWNCERI